MKTVAVTHRGELAAASHLINCHGSQLVTLRSIRLGETSHGDGPGIQSVDSGASQAGSQESSDSVYLPGETQ